MANFWFLLVALMLVAYVVLDGFDLGVGAIYKWVARTPEERTLVRRSIGPVWDANEVWLLAAGGTLYFAFPAALRLQLQRVLSAAHDGPVAADRAGAGARAAEPLRRRALRRGLRHASS